MYGCTQRGPSRTSTIQCDAVAIFKKKPFFPNGRVTVLRGSEYLDAGWHLRFPEKVLRKKDGTYRTDFGPCVNHIGVIYGETNHNVSAALRARMFSCRQPPGTWTTGQLAWDKLLAVNQLESVLKHYSALQDHAKGFSHLLDFTDVIQEVTDHHDDPHPKARLRRAAFIDELLVYGFASTHWGRNNYVTAKMKKDELAKYGKAPRIIVDLGVPMSLVGFRLTKFIKNVFAEELIINGGIGQYCDKPSHDKLQYHFEQLLKPIGLFHFVYFSDDSCWSVTTPTGVERFNVDIKSCDASHRHTFKLLYALFPPADHAVIDMLIDQLSKKVVIRDVNERKRKIIMKFDGPTLFSGSTLTTVLNNLAQWLALACVDEAFMKKNPARAIEEAYHTAGFMVTIDPVTFPELQFLKHSPVYDTNGTLRPVLNIGVMLRATGSCRGELPRGERFTTRAKVFQASLLAGMYPYTHFTLIDRMSHGSDIPIESKHVVGVSEHFTVSDHELYIRYNLTPREIEELNDSLGHASTGDFVSLDAIDKILKLDYESGVDWSPPREYYIDLI